MAAECALPLFCIGYALSQDCVGFGLSETRFRIRFCIKNKIICL